MLSNGHVGLPLCLTTDLWLTAIVHEGLPVCHPEHLELFKYENPWPEECPGAVFNLSRYRKAAITKITYVYLRITSCRGWRVVEKPRAAAWKLICLKIAAIAAQRRTNEAKLQCTHHHNTHRRAVRRCYTLGHYRRVLAWAKKARIPVTVSNSHEDNTHSTLQ